MAYYKTTMIGSCVVILKPTAQTQKQNTYLRTPLKIHAVTIRFSLYEYNSVTKYSIVEYYIIPTLDTYYK